MLGACRPSAKQAGGGREDSTFRYARHITAERHDGYTTVSLADPWHQGRVLHTYILVDHKDSARMAGHLPSGTVVYTPLRRMVVFTAAHANLAVWLHAGSAIVGVADPQYIHIKTSPNPSKGGGCWVDVGNSMKPDVEKIVSLRADAILLSPFENSGGYGRLEEIGTPIIECADYMETSALGRAEWMKFYGMLSGEERTADSLFAVVERNYNALKAQASRMKGSRSVLPDRKTGSVWYVPGGQSSVGLLYRDAGGRYAMSADRHSGSLALPFETVLDRMGNADFWILSYNGTMTRRQLLAEYKGYAALRPMKTGEVYGCDVDRTRYFEEVSWRPDWLLRDLIMLFHPGQMKGEMKYYNQI